MSKERELLKEALVVLEMVHRDDCDLYFAIEELLAQPEHIEDKLVMVEPAAWMYERERGDFTERTSTVGFEKNFDGITIPLYASPPKREPLDNVEIMTIAAEHTWDLKRFARAIEKAHGIGVDDE